ncbi:hypothetical protein TcBrA4_0000070 [Trypanosoma cruzi]|nr:hypothetical protein TcBrA4_0000070 [Trypanosoma cruzi]
MKRVNAIESNREEARERQPSVFCERSKHEAEKMTKELERRGGPRWMKLRGLWRRKSGRAVLCRPAAKTAFGCTSIRWRISRTRKQTEESASERLRQAMQQPEQELSLRQSAIETREQQLEMVQLDGAREREHHAERIPLRRCARTVREERCRQRRQWIHQIKEMNAKFPEQVRPLAERRKKKREQATANEDVAERALAAEVKMIEEYLPRLISVEDIPVNPEETGIIRRQFDEVFTQ